MRSRLLLPLLAFGQIVAAIDYNIVYVALPHIGSSLGFPAQQLQWVVSAYAVAFGGLLLFGGRAADVLGRSAVYRLALTIFGGGSLLGALAPTSAALICARVLQGLGGALLTPSTLSILNTEFRQGSERNHALAVWGGAGGVGLAAGSFLGGLLTQMFGWRAVFFVNVPLVLFALAVSVAALPAARRAGDLGDLDVLGALCVTVSVSALVFALSEGPSSGWDSMKVVTGIAVCAVLLLALVVVERHAPNPLLPSRLLTHHPLLTAMGVAFLFMGSFGTEYYLFTVYFQDVLGYSGLRAGLAFLPASLLAVVGTQLAKRALARIGTNGALITGLLVGAGGMLAIAAGMGVGRSYVLLLPGITALSVGQGIGWTATFAAAGTDVDAGDQGVASALASTSQQIGAAIGLAVLVAVANAGVTAARPAAEVVHGLRIAGVGASLIAAAAALIAWITARQVRLAEAERVLADA